ncbi:MAG: C4-type zinc ribbon domain-containing protein [Elusimicrobia bacterium]|nr:C4-type zinc ribbon domain-containing protein [Elusimicrobiota bacterium]
MAINKETIQRLVAVQEQDAVLDGLQKEMDRIPRAIAALRAGLEAAKAKHAEAKAKIIGFEKQKKEKELEMAAKEEAIRKHTMELNQVKTNDAFKALQHEIDQAKEAGSQIETEILEVMESIDAGRGDEKSAAAELKAAEGKANSEIAVLEGELGELKAKHEARKSVRDEAAALVPADMMRVYSHARMRGKTDAIVPVDGGNCSACRINLAPQMIVEVTKAKALVICESCQRILYKPEPAAKAAP